MSRIRASIDLTHVTSGISFRSAKVRTPKTEGFESAVIEVLTADETVDLGAVITARHIPIHLLSGDDLKIGFSDSVYPMRLSGAGDSLFLRLDVEGLVKTSTVVCEEDAGSSLSGVYFDLEDRNGTVRVWYSMVGSTPPSTPGGGRLVPVVILEDAADTAVATATKLALDADAEFSATVSTATVTIRDAHTGTRSDISAGTTGWTVATTQAGAASPVVHLRSVGTSRVAFGVAPH